MTKRDYALYFFQSHWNFFRILIRAGHIGVTTRIGVKIQSMPMCRFYEYESTVFNHCYSPTCFRADFRQSIASPSTSHPSTHSPAAYSHLGFCAFPHFQLFKFIVSTNSKNSLLDYDSRFFSPANKEMCQQTNKGSQKLRDEARLRAFLVNQKTFPANFFLQTFHHTTVSKRCMHLFDFEVVSHLILGCCGEMMAALRRRRRGHGARNLSLCPRPPQYVAGE